MSHDIISFKGNKEGIYIQIKELDFNTIKEELIKRLRETKNFFKGVKVIDIKGSSLTDIEVAVLTNIIEEFDIEVEIRPQDIEEIEEDEEIVPFIGIDEGVTKFIRNTLRSGQREEFDGNMVILGDTNPGSVIVAKGNIIVMGTLRGIAHAGSDGNKSSIVAAFKMKPTQLRIADIIARSPDHETLNPKWPEVAKIQEDKVIIEPYLQKK